MLVQLAPTVASFDMNEVLFGTQLLQRCLSSCRASVVAPLVHTKLGKKTYKINAHWTKQLTTKHQNVHRRARETKTHRAICTKNKYHRCIRVPLIFTFQKKETKLWWQMTCIWVRYAGMILYNFMQRWGTWVENRQLFWNGCLHWEVWPASGGGHFIPSSLCLLLQSPGSC